MPGMTPRPAGCPRPGQAVRSGPALAAAPAVRMAPCRSGRRIGWLLGTGLAVHARLRRALVLRDDGRGVDLGRCGIRPGGQRLLVAQRADRPVAVGQGPARMSADAVALVIPERFRAHHQFHVRPQVGLTDLDDVVAFLPEGAGDGPVAVHRDVDEGDPEAEILDVGDDAAPDPPRH